MVNIMANTLHRHAGNYAGQYRQRGIKVSGVPVDTDVEGLVLVTGAANRARTDAGFTTQFVVSPTQTVTLNATQLIAIETAVQTFVAAVFAAEATVNAAIGATPPTITTRAQVDAVFNAVSRTY